ncbi:hypothetical protein BDV18DRAFT_156404 [Aspergillus unguis]
MLRSKPTRIALTEDDLCYHIDRIFQRNCDLARWHQQRESSGNDYDGDNDEDDPYIHSDDCPTPDSLFGSDCEEPQSQSFLGNGRQEVPANERSTGTNNITRPRHQRSVRFASPEPQHEPEPALEPESESLDSSSHAVRIKRREQSVHQQHRAALDIELAILSDADWTGVGSDFPGQHNYRTSLSPSLPTPEHSRSTRFVLDTNFASLLSPVTIFPVRLLGQEHRLAQFESPHISSLLLKRLPSGRRLGSNVGSSQATGPFNPRPNQLPEQQLVTWKSTSITTMARTRRTASVSACEELQRPELKAQEGLTEGVPNSGTRTVQISAPEDPEQQPGKEPLSTPAKEVEEGLQDKDGKDAGHLVHPKTISRATQTDPDLTSPLRQNIVDEPVDNREGNLERQENIAPGATSERPCADWPRQDPFISAMFPEPSAPVYDASAQIRIGMQGYVNRPVSRGREARTEQGAIAQFVHPTLVDAAVFQEYVQRMIDELDRAP